MMNSVTNGAPKGAPHGSDAQARSQRVKGAFLLAAHMPFWAFVAWATFTHAKSPEADAGGTSAWMAGFVGLCLISFGITAAALRASASFLADPEEADDLRQQGRALLLGAGALISAGVALILLSISGPERQVSPEVGVAGYLVLSVLAMLLVGIRWRLLDELNRALHKEAHYLAFVWLSLVGGTWAALAHLGFVTGPAPLDWVTMISGFSFAGGLLALARTGGMARL